MKPTLQASEPVAAVRQTERGYNLMRDTLKMIGVGIAQGHITARDVEKLYSDGPKRVTVLELIREALEASPPDAAPPSALLEQMAKALEVGLDALKFSSHGAVPMMLDAVSAWRQFAGGSEDGKDRFTIASSPQGEPFQESLPADGVQEDQRG